MVVGIEITADALRINPKPGVEDGIKELLGLSGLAPVENEPFVWDNQLAFRNSKPGPYVSLMDVWAEFSRNSINLHKDKKYTISKCGWQTQDGQYTEKLTADLIADAVRQNTGESRVLHSALAIDNTLHEFHQETVLKSLNLAGFTNIELLWRPICIALHYLNSMGRDQFDDEDRLVVVDTDSFLPELTVLRLKEHDGELVPVRNLPENSPPFGYEFSTYKVINNFIEFLADGTPYTPEQLKSGPNAQAIFAFLVGKESGDIWVRDGVRYERFLLKSSQRQKFIDFSYTDINFINLREMVLDHENWGSYDYILWNGLLCRTQDEDVFTDKEWVMEEDAISGGAADYVRRRQQDKPTYLDTLPELEIMSAVEGTARHEFFPLIKGGEVEGGGVKRTSEPLDKFKLEKDTTEFTAILRINEEECKKLVTQLDIETPTENIPLLIKAEQRPANGNAVVSIEGDENHQDVFGRQRQIRLDWKSMEPFEYSHYSGPEVYPVGGRILDDPEIREIVKNHVEYESRMGSIINYQGYRCKFYQLFEPWGWRSCDRRIKLEEPTRGIFGAKLTEDSEVIDLAKKLVPIIEDGDQNNRHKHLNQLFIYTPESFLNELRDIFSSKNPDINSWNTVFAPGRTFYKAKDFQLFLDFIIRKSKQNGYPNYPDDSYTRIYFWSFFRGLCYYEDTVNVPEKKVSDVLRTLYNYVNTRYNEGWRAWQGETGRWERLNIENTKKFCLCAILFSLRLRKKHTKFLNVGSELNDLMIEAINEKIGQVRFPSSMLENVENDTLSNYVYRFITEEESEEDIGILKGLTTSMG